MRPYLFGLTYRNKVLMILSYSFLGIRIPSGQKFLVGGVPFNSDAGTPTGWVSRHTELLEGFGGTGVRVPVGGPARGAYEGLAETEENASRVDISRQEGFEGKKVNLFYE